MSPLLALAAAAAWQSPPADSAQVTASNGIMVRIERDEFDPETTIAGPVHAPEHGLKFTAMAVKPLSGPPRVFIAAVVTQIRGLIDTGQIENVFLKGGRSPRAQIGSPKLTGCLRENCFYDQLLTIYLSKADWQQASGQLELKLSGRSSHIISVPTAELDAVLSIAISTPSVGAK